MTVRVLLADDQALIRAGIRALIDSADDLQVVGEVADGSQVLAAVRATDADLVLMDIRMPNVDGVHATRLLAAEPDLTEVKVLVLTTFEVDEYVLQALRAGDSGFVGKGVLPDELLAAIRTVAAGEALLSPRATKALISQYLARPADVPIGVPGTVLAGLTEREREIVALVAYGLTNDDIASRLVVSPLTAKTHVNRAMAKLGVRDRAQLVVHAYRSGLVRPDEDQPPARRR